MTEKRKASAVKTEKRAGKAAEGRGSSERRKPSATEKARVKTETDVLHNVRSARTDAGAGGGRSAGNHRRRRARRAAKGNPQPIVDSFRHAFDGIMIGVEERNMKIHFGFALLVIIFGLLLKISVTEWCFCFVLFGLIMGLELVNTAIEAVVDLVTEEYRPLAKRAKDTAAGAVLIAAIMAAITGLIIFIPRFLYFLRIV